MRKYLCLLLLACSLLFVNAQKSFNDFMQPYPFGEDPNVRYLSSYAFQEKLVIETSPIVRYSIYNNFLKGLMNDAKHMQAWYLAFKPQVRIYADNSKPVKTPSYRSYLGTQHLYRLPSLSDSTAQFWGFCFETGHYSNGQDMSAYSSLYPDGSPQSDSIYNTINSKSNLSDMLNRKSGNFSTNLSELSLNYRYYLLDENYLPASMHSFSLTYVLYHDLFMGVFDFGGYTEQDIKIYGKNRFQFTYEYLQVFKHWGGRRIQLKENLEYIYKPHPWVNRWRVESMATLYPFAFNKSMGVFASYIYGHDNYNYRFVDSGQQFSIGISWSQFPLFQMKRGF